MSGGGCDSSCGGGGNTCSAGGCMVVMIVMVHEVEAYVHVATDNVAGFMMLLLLYRRCQNLDRIGPDRIMNWITDRITDRITN